MINISVFLLNICFGCVVETAQGNVSFMPQKHMFLLTVIKKFINRPYSRNPVCPKFTVYQISEYFEKSELKFLRF